jgi:hypothetical protein
MPNVAVPPSDSSALTKYRPMIRFANLKPAVNTSTPTTPSRPLVPVSEPAAKTATSRSVVLPTSATSARI